MQKICHWSSEHQLSELYLVPHLRQEQRSGRVQILNSNRARLISVPLRLRVRVRVSHQRNGRHQGHENLRIKLRIRLSAERSRADLHILQRVKRRRARFQRNYPAAQVRLDLRQSEGSGV